MSEKYELRWQDLVNYVDADQELLEKEHARAKNVIDVHVDNVNNGVDVQVSEQVILEYDYYRQKLAQELRRRLGGCVVPYPEMIDIDSDLL